MRMQTYGVLNSKDLNRQEADAEFLSETLER